ncbi:MAG: PKD domain-containing protein, partial [Bacteroidota bacterium]
MFSGSQAGPNAQYIWDFGYGTQDTLTNSVTVHVFAQPNQYNVCLTIIDTTGQGCVDSICLPVDAGLGANSCQANFTWNKTAAGTYQFSNLSVPQADSTVTYFWDFGDNTTSNEFNPPLKTFNGSGPWTVCLSVGDSSGNCFDQICYDVEDTVQALNVSGLVLTNGNPAFSGVVYLVQHDSTTLGGASLTAVDSTYLNGSFYHFQNVQPGTYLLKAALLPGSFNYSSFMPTYLGDELFWYNATSTIVGSGSIVNPPINLVAGNNPGGPGFIGGFVAQGANKQGDPMANVSILLMNEDMGAVTHVVTDQNGDFALEDLAFGTYHVYVEMMGRYADPYTLTLSPDNPSHNGIEFEVSDQDVTITSLREIELAQDLKAFPNPTEGRLSITWNQLEVAPAEVKLRNLMGQELRSESLNQAQGRIEVNWNL